MRERTTASSTEQGSPLTRKTAPGGFPEDTTDMLLRGPEEGPPSTPSQPHWPTLPSCRRGDRGPGGGMVVTYPRSLAAGVSFLPAMPSREAPSQPTGFPPRVAASPRRRSAGSPLAGTGRGGKQPWSSKPKGKGLHAPQGMAPGGPQRWLSYVDAEPRETLPTASWNGGANLPAPDGAWHFSRLSRCPQCPGYELKLGIRRHRGFHPSRTTP